MAVVEKQQQYIGTGGLSDELAEQLAEEVEQIRIEAGVADTATIVTWARDHKDSTWYEQLEWKNTKAGELWRRQQVRNTLHRIRFVQPDGESSPRAFVTYVAPPLDPETEPQRSYVSIAEVLSDKEKSRQHARRIFTRMYGEYESLREVEDAFKQLPGFLNSMAKVAEKILD